MGEVFAGSRQVKKHEYASRPNAFLFKGIINSSRCSMYKDGGHIEDQSRNLSSFSEPIPVNGVYTLTNPEEAFASTNNHHG